MFPIRCATVLELRLQQMVDFYEKPNFTIENFKFRGAVKLGLKNVVLNYQKVHPYTKSGRTNRLAYVAVTLFWYYTVYTASRKKVCMNRSCRLMQWRSFADKTELVQCELGASVDIIWTQYAVRSVASGGLSESGWHDHVDQDAPQHGLRRSELVAVVALRRKTMSVVAMSYIPCPCTYILRHEKRHCGKRNKQRNCSENRQSGILVTCFLLPRTER